MIDLISQSNHLRKVLNNIEDTLHKILSNNFDSSKIKIDHSVVDELQKEKKRKTRKIN